MSFESKLSENVRLERIEKLQRIISNSIYTRHVYGANNEEKLKSLKHELETFKNEYPEEFI